MPRARLLWLQDGPKLARMNLSWLARPHSCNPSGLESWYVRTFSQDIFLLKRVPRRALGNIGDNIPTLLPTLHYRE